MSADDGHLAPVISAIGEGAPVDWAAWDAGAESAEDRTMLETLRRVEALAAFSRARQRDALPEWSGEPGLWGPLVLLEPVGRGTSGEVWRAWEPRLRREVALKFLAPELAGDPVAAARLVAEGRNLARVRHPGVAAVYGIEEHAGRVGLWREFVSGTDLFRAVAAEGPFDPASAASAGAELADALAAIHAAGLLHGDVKAENVVRESGGRLVLTDLGLAQQRTPAARLEATRVSGTPMYLAPEVLAGGAATVRSEIYSIGVLLYYLLSGAHPHAATTLAELRRSLTEGGARSLRAVRPGLPEALVAVVEGALDPDPARRPADAETLAAALRAAVRDDAVEIDDGEDSDIFPGVPRRGLLAVATLFLVAGIALLFYRQLTRTGAAPAVPYDVEAVVVRIGASGAEPLAAGDRVNAGDQLQLQFMATRATHVYVLAEDERGEAYLLFPQPAYDLANPLPGGHIHRLPGAIEGRAAHWTVTSAGGREHLLIVASPEPLPHLERALAAIPAPVRGRLPEATPIPLPSEAVRLLRGIGGYDATPGATRPEAPRPLFEVVRRLAGRESGIRGVWLRQIVLENPVGPGG